MSATESPDELLERLRWEREASPARSSATIQIAISGGRDRTPSQPEMDAFWRLWFRLNGDVLHHGAARGTDRAVALAWEARTGRRPVAHPVSQEDWQTLGKAAGPLRNKEMMTKCSALIAFPGGRGTESCIRAAKQQGKPVYYVLDEIPGREKAEVELPEAAAAKTTRTPSVCACVGQWSAWTWWPRWTAWRGSCSACNTVRWATGAEAAIIEREVEKHCGEARR